MCLEGCHVLVLPCTILMALIALTLGLLIEADRQGVVIPAVAPWVTGPLRQCSERLGQVIQSQSDEEKIISLLSFLDSTPMCSAVPSHEIDSCAEWAGCMLASGLGSPEDGTNSARVKAIQAARNGSPIWLQRAWTVTLCAKQFTSARDTWTVSPAPPSHVAVEESPGHRQPGDAELRDRISTIKHACLRAWSAYQKLAWGSDELLPLSRIGHRYRGNGLGIFLVGAMETLHLLGEQQAFDSAVAWVAGNSSSIPGAFDQSLNIDATDGSWSTAEIVTDLVGSLLSGYQLSGYEVLLDAADSTAGRITDAFETRSGLPLQQCDLGRAVCHRPDSYPHNPRGDATIEETWAVGLELAILAHKSKRGEHWRHNLGQIVAKSSRTMLEAIDNRATGAWNRLTSADYSLEKTHGTYARLMEQTELSAAAYGLTGLLIDPDSGQWVSNSQHTVAYGGRHGRSAERYYSGLVHQYIWWSALASENASATSRSGVTVQEAAELALRCKHRYELAIEGLRRLLIRRSAGPHKLWYIGELLQGRQFSPAFTFSSCGLSGTLALGHLHGLDDKHRSHLILAEHLAESCVRLSQLTASGLPPDLSWLNGRPALDREAVEWFLPNENNHNHHREKGFVSSPSEEGRDETTRPRLESGEVVVVRDKDGSASCSGRPALAQSLYWLYRATNHPKYVEWGWQHYQALEQHARLPREDAGYGTVSDVTKSSSTHRDEMKGWMLTTFKWLWLLQQEASGHAKATPAQEAIPNSVGH